MNELTQARTEIERIDGEIARLFESRMKVCETVADYKKERGLSVKDPEREAVLLSKCREKVEDPDIASYYVSFQKHLMELSCAYQSKRIAGMKVAYCGVEGAFAHIAASRMFPEATLVPCEDFAAAYKGVEDGLYDCAVLPLENSYAGEVGAVTDLLFSGSLYVNQITDLPVRHDLLCCEGATVDSITTVVSHPQALEQCKEYIARHGLKTETYGNTALAAKYVKESGDTSLAAIASEDTADLFGLRVLEGGINDVSNNTTRFAAVSRVQNLPLHPGTRENDAFLLMFTVKNQAGALAQTLNIIGAHGYNMRSLRSRPMKNLQWSYYFYIEAEGNLNNENGRSMLRELSAVCARLKTVGQYSAGIMGE